METGSILTAIKDSPIIGVYIYQEKGRIVFANETFLKFTGYTKEEILKKSVSDIIDGPEKQLAIENTNKRLSGNRFASQYKHIYFKTKGGFLKPALLFAHSIVFQNKPSGLVMVIDKTREKAYEKLFFALSRINELIIKETDELELLKKLVDIMVDNIGYTVCILGRINPKTKLINKIHTRSIYKEVEVLSEKYPISVDPSKPYGRGSAFKAYTTKDVSLVPEVKLNLSMSYWGDFYRKFNIHSACSIPIIKNGEVEYIIILLDTAPHAFDEDHMELLNKIKLNLSFALEKIEYQYNTTLFKEALEKTHEWAVITDRDGVILNANNATCDISKYSKEELIGKKPSIFKSGYHTKEFYQKLWKTILSGETFSGHFTNRAKDGSIFYLDSIIIPIKHNGEIHRFVDLSRDITKEVIYSERLKFQSSLYNTLFHLTTLSAQARSKDDYLKSLTELFVRFAHIDVAFLAKPSSKGHLKIENASVIEPSFSKLIEDAKELLSRYDSLPQSIPALKSIKRGRVYIQNDATDDKLSPINQIAKKHNIGSCCAIPIKESSKTIASLILVSRRKDLFDKKLFELVNAVANQIELILNKIEEEKFLRIILKAINVGFEFVFITDKDLRVVYINDSLKQVSGYKQEEVLGRPLFEFLGNQEDKKAVKELIKKAKNGDTVSKAITYIKRDGSLASFLTTITPYLDKGKIEYFIGVGKEITNEEELIEELNRLLNYDSLTGLLNAKAFIDSTDKFLLRAKKEKQIGAIAIINPISFKSINEAFGFDTGNAILKQIADRLKGSTFNYDVVAKLESDRFGVLLKDLKKEEDSLIASARILSELSKPYKINNSNLVLSFNIGLSLYPKDGHSPKELLNKAQIALADAKTKGEGRIGFFRKDFELKATKLIKLKAELELALKNNEFKAYYQTCVDKDGRILGAEALIRWIKDNQIIPPSEFIDQLEQSDLIVDVEDRFMENVMLFLKRLKDEGIKRVPIAINLSVKSLKRPDLYERVNAKLKRININPKNIKFEIVERSFLENFQHLRDLILRFKKDGVLFSVDDFGTGYSSLSYLAKLPVDFLKIDISFTRALDDPKIKSIVKSIIFLSKELNLRTIAEGVETREQFEELKRMGCECFQGYLFSRPLPEEDFRRLLMNNG